MTGDNVTTAGETTCTCGDGAIWGPLATAEDVRAWRQAHDGCEGPQTPRVTRPAAAHAASHAPELLRAVAALCPPGATVADSASGRGVRVEGDREALRQARRAIVDALGSRATVGATEGALLVAPRRGMWFGGVAGGVA